MGKPFLNLNDVNSKQLLSKSARGWTICLGAGINKNILPDWSDLTLNVINKTFKFNWSKADFEKQNNSIGFGYDSWIQACLNNHLSRGEKVASFIKILENEIYGNILIEAENAGIRDIMVQFLNNPRMKKTKRNKIISFFENKYSGSTLMQVVDVLTSKSDVYKYPCSIITFNADTLLYSLLIAYNEDKYSTLTNPNASEPYKLILKSYHSWGDKIPIFHLHGSLFPDFKKTSRRQDGRENLIFLESSYTKVAGSMYTWAQTNFLYYALNTKMIFLGLSMSDPNIRKWLSWTTENVNADLSLLKDQDTNANQHLWIKPRCRESDTTEFLQNSLVHLGVKMGWIDGYDKTKGALLNIMEK